MKKRKIAIVGGGPAGLLAAVAAAEQGAHAVVFEKNKMTGRKLRITGKGRCNITNGGDVRSFVTRFGPGGRFLYSAFSRFFHQDIVELLAEEGVEVKEERGARLFPASDKAADVADALERRARAAGAEIRLGVRVLEVLMAPASGEGADRESAAGENASGAERAAGAKRRVTGLRIASADGKSSSVFPCDAVILATGGLSYPLTGSTGDGYAWAERAGHRIVKPRPALVPMESDAAWVSGLSGLSLRNVRAALFAGGKELDGLQGEMLFAHFGLTGPIILSLSRSWRPDLPEPVYVSLDLKPALSEEALDKRLLRDFEKFHRKRLKNSLNELLPQAMIPVVIQAAGLDGERPVAELTKEERAALLAALKDLRVPVTGLRPIDEAIITAGGVDLARVNPRTMASREAEGLYFAGELLDIDGCTGGYNLQAAYSTGWVAGESASMETR